MSPQKVESWRLEELAMLLDSLAASLEAAGSPEWARVFRHFREEARNIQAVAAHEADELKRLVRNIGLCFRDHVTIPDLSVDNEGRSDSSGINLRPSQAKARLRQALAEIDSRLIEYVS
jgi:hypothetical protein